MLHLISYILLINLILCNYYDSKSIVKTWSRFLARSVLFAQPNTGQFTEVTCSVIGRTQPELTPNKKQNDGPWTQPCIAPPKNLCAEVHTYIHIKIDRSDGAGWGKPSSCEQNYPSTCQIMPTRPIWLDSCF